MYAVIDLGSNSFHLLIAQHADDGFHLVDRCSEKIQLADGLNGRGELSQAAIQRGLNCLALFKRILSQHPVQELRVVATQALRQARNAAVFVQQAKNLGFDVDIISGTQEAELIFRGINDPLPPYSGNRLVIDIGGASTEIAVGNSDRVLFTQSLPMGCVCWRDRFFSDGIEYRHRGPAAKAAARQILEPCREAMADLDWGQSYASSGSAKMLSTISMANHWTQGEVTKACVHHIETALADIPQYSDIHLQGLKPARQDLLAPGISIMASIMESLEIETICYSPTALREGILGEISARRVSYIRKNPKSSVRVLGT